MPLIEKALSRRSFGKLAGTVLILLALPQPSDKSLPSPITERPPENENYTKRSKGLGFTFSAFQCQNLGLDSQQTKDALEQLCSLGFDRIRVCTYWNRIDNGNQLDFTELDWQLEMAAKYKKDVVLTVGIKSPRSPEFFYPARISEKFPDVGEVKPNPLEKYPPVADYALDYIQKVVEQTRDHPAVSYYQVENEPLNPVEVSGLKYLSFSFIQREVELVKALKRNQKILLTNSIGGPSTDEMFNQTLALNPDAIGINVYYKSAVPVPEPITHFINQYYDGASALWDSQIVKWAEQMALGNIEPWAAEIQAEPWELNIKSLLDQENYPSANSTDSIELAKKLGNAGYKTRLFWGAEYWVAHDLKFGGQQWLKPMRDFANS